MSWKNTAGFYIFMDGDANDDDEFMFLLWVNNYVKGVCKAPPGIRHSLLFALISLFPH